MSESPKALFLSYAREDADAARRIAEALRGFGIEVWFDQSELRGGDQWDQKIRTQIKACALFIPIISTTTQSREEAYFRLEWKLADDRSHLMAPGRTFIVPVVIDDTPDAGAAVPDSFLRAQWTRLSGGAPSPQFIERINQLLTAPKKPALKADLPRPPTLPPMLKQAAQAKKAAQTAEAAQAAVSKKSGLPAWIWIVATIIVVAAAAAYYFLRRPEPVATPPTVAAKPAPAVPAAALAKDDKSIAVLPFDNMSDDKDSGFFADGVHEDLLTSLAKIGDLKVISRTSVMEYRGTKKKIQQIATELGVAYVLEGSVRRANNKVRIVCQLIDGRTGRHVLAPDPYDRDLADIFAIQSELAKNIAEKLQAVLSPGEKAALERPPTESLAAYDLYLKARQIADRESNRRLRVVQTQPLYEEAVRLDPKFAVAWVALAGTQLETFNYIDRSAAVAAKAKEAIDRALSLEPDNVGAVGMLANYYIDVRDLPRAAEVVERLKHDFPNQAQTFYVRARLAVRQGQRAEGLACYRETVKLDPRNAAAWESLQSALWFGRRYDEALACTRKVLEIVPDNLVRAYTRALIAFDATGSTAEMEKLLATLTPEVRRSDPTAVTAVAGWARICGDADTLIRTREDNPGSRVTFDSDGGGRPLVEAYLAKGQTERARPILEQECARLQALLEKEPDNADIWALLAYARAMLRDRAGAMAARQKAMANSAVSRSFSDSYFYAWLGDKDEALSALFRKQSSGLSGSSNILTVHRLRHGLILWPLVGDPRFEAFLNDPKNNAPLF